MSSKKLIELKINGENYDATVSGSETLLTLLRDQLDLTGTKVAVIRVFVELAQ